MTVRSKAIAISLVLLTALPASAESLRERYDGAATFSRWHIDDSIHNAHVSVHWSAQGRFLWYVLDEGSDRVLVVRRSNDGRMVTRTSGLRLLDAASRAAGAVLTWESLTAAQPVLTDTGRSVELEGRVTRVTCNLNSITCKPIEGSIAAPPGSVISPDRHWAAFVAQYNLWVRDLQTGTERALTDDGALHDAYAGTTEQGQAVVAGRPNALSTPPAVVWSPDSRHLVTVRIDETAIPDLPIIETVPRDSLLPRVHTVRYNLLLQSQRIRQTLYVVDVQSGVRQAVHLELPFVAFDSILFLRRVWWRADGREFALAVEDPAERWIELQKVDPTNGASRLILHEEARYRVHIASELARPPAVALLANGDVIWYSERDGFGQLYLIDGTLGGVRNPITRGNRTVHDLLAVDERLGWIYFTAGGETEGPEPYYASVFRVRTDGGGLTRLTAEDADHLVPGPTIGPGSPTRATERGFAPDARRFINVRSTPSDPEITELRAADGHVVAQLSKAELGGRAAQLYSAPQRVSFPAPDGTERLHGLLYLPPHFDPTSRYPIIDVIYNGNQVAATPRRFAEATFNIAHSLAEIGCLVLMLDARGTPLRSRSFLEVAYEHPDQVVAIGDHVQAIRLLAAQRPYVDLSRVGITGVSNGGYAALRAMLAYPDFFTVGVSVNGSHDLRKYLAGAGLSFAAVAGGDPETALSPLANQEIASQLRGKLLLMLGGMDANVPPASTFGVMQALISAGRNFDTVIVPQMGHSMDQDRFAVRKQWDYFAEHLLGEKPPAIYLPPE